MPTKIEGLLDHGALEDVRPDNNTWKSLRATHWGLDIVRPEFLALRPSSPKKLVRRTAWLDGLRGFAAFLVYLHHHQLWSHDIHGNSVFENSFGYNHRHYFAALPFVRHFFSGGHFAVAIFFVISGYVLSVKPLGLIQKGQHMASADSVGSALFRRWLRLYLPVIGFTLSWMVARHWTNVWVDFGERKDSWGEEFKTWYYTFKNYSFVFLTGDGLEFTSKYNGHLWSIPMEFRGSVIVYTTSSALSRCTMTARLCCEVALIIYFLYVVDGWYGALFVGGMLLSDLDLLSLNDQEPRILSKLKGFKEFIFFHLFLVAMYLGGVPSCESLEGYQNLLASSPGWKWLFKLKPQAVWDFKWFYLTWAAIFTVASIPRLPLLKRFFETRFCQYLGRISFALYLVHGIVIHVFTNRLYAAVGFKKDGHKNISHWVGLFPLTMNGPMGFELAFWAVQIINIPVTFYAAEVVTKLFDEPSVKFSTWLYKQTLEPQPESPRR
ncbi:acyltransferase family-domain-containing protein [Boeremia exigua]|uniref:acyltransferase family-domain-containing protein n=1 Tax=Boeremia exigua TaxID=749465 RepID=UPI001E8CEF37|nr:acyltransferase family-domain-containing protein [Boeremia exigua]KAH6644310.1 acyltransferase family-domain-containing protein [Boeremia exigua]